MSRIDRFFGAMDAYWLQVTGRSYRVDVRLDLRRDLSTETLDTLDSTAAAVHDVLSDTGYGPAIYEVEPLVDDDTASATYGGRVDGRPQINIDPETWNVPESLAHEMGHDAVMACDAAPAAPPLIQETYDEMVAGLTARAAMDRIDHDDPPSLDPFCPAHEKEWDRIRGILDQDNRDQEHTYLQEIRDAADRTDWRGMDQAADRFGATPPATGPVTDSLTYTVPDSMATENLFSAAYTTKHVVETIARSWRWMERGPNDAATALLDDCETPDNWAQHLVRETGSAGPDHPRYTQRMHAALETAIRRYEDLIRARTAPNPDTVIDAFAEEMYGHDPDTGEGYDDHIDLPHTVGDRLAATLYDHGTGPEALLDAPGRAATLCRDALTHTVRYACDQPADHPYDLTPLVTDTWNPGPV